MFPGWPSQTMLCISATLKVFAAITHTTNIWRLMRRHNSILKYQFASFLPNTKCVQSHPEGFLPLSDPVGQKSPMQSPRKKSKTLTQLFNSTGPTGNWVRCMYCREGLLLPSRLAGDNRALPCGQKSKWRETESLHAIPVDTKELCVLNALWDHQALAFSALQLQKVRGAASKITSW